MSLTRVESFMLDFNSPGGFTVDEQSGAASFKVDAVNRRVGIGTSSPDKKLHVYSDEGTVARFESTDADSALIRFVNGTSGNVYVGIKGSDFFLRAGTSERLRVTSGGNVGIGTSSPNEKLHIHGTVKVTSATPSPGISIVDTDAGGSFLISQYNSGDAILSNNASGRNFVFQTNDGAGAAEVLRITSDGYVGIGTDTPTAPLHISGTSSADARIKIEDNDNGFAASEIAVANGGRDLKISAPQDIYFEDLDTGNKTLYIKEGGNVGIGTDNPGTTLVLSSADPRITITDTDAPTRSTQLRNTAGNTYLSNLTSGHIIFGAPTEMMRIQDNGRVGIGTQSPSYDFDVSKTTDDGSVVIRAGNNSDTGNVQSLLQLRVGSTSTKYVNFNVNYAASYLHISGANVPTLYNSFDTQIFRKSDGTEKLRFTSTGNVGIGTASPNRTLHVQGNFSLSGSAHIGAVNQSTSNLRDSQTTVNRTPKVQINSNSGPGSSLGLISWHSATAGYYSPQLWLAKSNASDDTVGTNTLVTNGTDLGAINFAGNDGATFLNAASIRAEVDGTAATNDMPGRLVFFTNGGAVNPTEQMRLDSNGRLGIGADNPLHKLQVVGSASVSGNNGENYNQYATLIVGERGANDAVASIQLHYAVNTMAAKIDGRQNTWAVWSDWNSQNLDRLKIDGTGTTEVVDLRPGGVPVVKSYYDTTAGSSIGYAIINGTLTLQRQNTSNEGGDLRLTKAIDNTTHYSIDVYGHTTAPVLRVVNTTAGRADIYLLDNGNVGIGTSAPASKLQINEGHIKLQAASADTRVEFVNTTQGSSGWIGIPSWNSNGLMIYAPGGAGTGNYNAANIDSGIWQLNTHDGTTLTQALKLTQAGLAEFAKDVEVYGLTLGRGSGDKDTNCVFGKDAFVSNTNGFQNVVIGEEAMYNSDGNANTVVGAEAMYNNTTGSNNVAIGHEALWSNVGFANYNVAVGHSAVEGNVNIVATSLVAGTTYTISSNTATDFTTVGAPDNNVGTTFTATGPVTDPNAIGFARTRNTASNIVAIGSLALYRNTVGDNNVAVGASALTLMQEGENNTAIGHESGKYLTSGGDNYNYSNCTTLGHDARISGGNQVQLGDSSTTTYAYGSVQNRSDARDKTDVRDTLLGLDFIKSLRPVDFRWDYRDKYFDREEFIDENGNPDARLVPVPKDGSRSGSRFHHGLIAQEVKAAADAQGVDFAGYQDHSINGGIDVQSVGYTELIGPLIKAVQELSAENAAMRARLDALEGA